MGGQVRRGRGMAGAPVTHTRADVPRLHHYVLAIASLSVSLMAACTPDRAGTSDHQGESVGPGGERLADRPVAESRVREPRAPRA